MPFAIDNHKGQRCMTTVRPSRHVTTACNDFTARGQSPKLGGEVGTVPNGGGYRVESLPKVVSALRVSDHDAVFVRLKWVHPRCDAHLPACMFLSIISAWNRERVVLGMHSFAHTRIFAFVGFRRFPSAKLLAKAYGTATNALALTSTRLLETRTLWASSSRRGSGQDSINCQFLREEVDGKISLRF